MRCITAIWPAGPPKLSAATLAQTPTASRNEMPCVGVSAFSVAAVAATWILVIRISFARAQLLLLAAVLYADVVIDLAGRAGIVTHAAFAMVAAFFAGIRFCGRSVRVGVHAANERERNSGDNERSHQCGVL